ncbi:GDSL esterase/lipase At5g03610-like isoform X1 [Cryptomeria japonica]|uniref:GDSL esterase/lipase At5g03610-like isoform X1 n=1 Tax=Cryptomeria japonica TaxID=3369 RepID=UPI0027DA5BB7|nr:GDSL esterase/lipase At5g03610-like isoform X1 [Cryptomeria japonica]
MDAMFSRLLFLIIILSLFAGRGNAEKARALFVFGDSYADTGNRNPYNQSVNQPWKRPYGFTSPGYPAGRFSSGKIQTDFWGDILGLPVPIPYELLKSHECKATANKVREGVNFAVGGSAIFRAYGFITVAQQVKQFKKLIVGRQGFDSHKLSRSVVLISVAGNDYGAFLSTSNGSIEGLIDLVTPVVSGIIEAVKDLYECGLRNFALSNMFSLGCMPQIGRTSCDSTYDNITALHMRLLREGVESLRSNFKEISIITSDLVPATNYIFSNHRQYGFVELLVPCCAARGRVDLCGEVDQVGRPLFEVCSNVEEFFYWDSVHPTQRGWHAIMSLYSNGVKGDNKIMSFIEGAPNVIAWLHSIGFVADNVSSS